MRILTRYVLKEFLVPLFYCLTGFVSIYVLFELFGSFSRMMEAHLGWGNALRYFCGYLAPYFHYIMPAALMMATLYTMWMFCRHSEITAMRASGVSFLAIVKPLLAVALAAAGLVVWVNESYVPRNAHWAAQMKTEKFELARLDRADNLVYRNAAAGRTWNVGRMLDEDARRLADVSVAIDRPGGKRLMSVVAERADYLDGEWWFTNAKVQHYDELGAEVPTPTPELDALTWRCFGAFGETPTDFVMQNRPWKFNSVRDRIRYLETHPELTKTARDDLRYDVWAQIMAPLACLVITLFAIPAGIASGRQSVFKGILGAIGMYFAFYGVTIGAMVMAKNGWLDPVVGAVSPGALFLVLGVISFRRQR